MSIDPLTAAELQIFVGGLIAALVGWYFIHQEKKSQPGKETSVSGSSRTLAEDFPIVVPDYDSREKRVP